MPSALTMSAAHKRQYDWLIGTGRGGERVRAFALHRLVLQHARLAQDAQARLAPREDRAAKERVA